MNIRTAAASDCGAILDAIEGFVVASSYRSEPVNREHVLGLLIGLIQNQDGIVAVLEDDQGKFAGVFIGMAHAHLFSGRKILSELFIYTRPSARGHGSKLREFAEEWGRENGCLMFIIAHPVSEAHLEKVYRRWGFAPHEAHYQKELN
jgi:GNAT superfamily N-acetyltransferase